jgi:hypothetical protein
MRFLTATALAAHLIIVFEPGYAGIEHHRTANPDATGAHPGSPNTSHFPLTMLPRHTQHVRARPILQFYLDIAGNDAYRVSMQPSEPVSKFF